MVERYLSDKLYALMCAPATDAVVTLASKWLACGIHLIVDDGHVEGYEAAQLTHVKLSAALGRDADSETLPWHLLAALKEPGHQVQWWLLHLPEDEHHAARDVSMAKVALELGRDLELPTLVTSVHQDVLDSSESIWQRKVAHRALLQRGFRKVRSWRDSVEGKGQTETTLEMTPWPMGDIGQVERYFDADEWLCRPQPIQSLGGPPPTPGELVGLGVGLEAIQWGQETPCVALVYGGRLCSLGVGDVSVTQAYARAMSRAPWAVSGGLLIGSHSPDLTTMRALGQQLASLRVFASVDLSEEVRDQFVSMSETLVLNVPSPLTGGVHADVYPTPLGLFRMPRRPRGLEFTLGDVVTPTDLEDGVRLQLQLALHVCSLLPGAAAAFCEANGTLALCAGQALSDDALQVGMARVKGLKRASAVAATGLLSNPAVIAGFANAGVKAAALLWDDDAHHEVVKVASEAKVSLVRLPAEISSIHL